MRKILTTLVIICLIFPSYSATSLNHETKYKEIENHNCIFFGAGYFLDFAYIEDEIFLLIISWLEKIMRMTDLAFMFFLISYLLIINNIPGMKMPHVRYIYTFDGVGYVASIGKDGAWIVKSKNFRDSFSILVKNFTGIWMQIPIIINPIKYPIFMDVFFGYGEEIDIIYWD